MGNLSSKVMRQRVPMAYVLSVNVFALLERAEIVGNQEELRLELRTQAERVNTSSPKTQRTQGCVQTRGWRRGSATLWLSPLHPVAPVSSLQPAPHSLKFPWRASVYADRHRITWVPVTFPTSAFSPCPPHWPGDGQSAAQQHWGNSPPQLMRSSLNTCSHKGLHRTIYFNSLCPLCFLLPVYKPQQHPTLKSQSGKWANSESEGEFESHLHILLTSWE